MIFSALNTSSLLYMDIFTLDVSSLSTLSLSFTAGAVGVLLLVLGSMVVPPMLRVEESKRGVCLCPGFPNHDVLEIILY